MGSIKFYHNPRCRKSREALAILRDRQEEIKIVEYLKDTLSKQELSKIINLLQISPFDLVRKNENIWKDNFKDQTLTEKEIIAILSKHPKLIERPIIINNDKAVIGRPPEKVLDIL